MGAIDRIEYKHARLARLLERELENMPLPSSGPLFTESSLVERFGVSRATVRRALAELERRGLIERKPKLGTFPGAKLLGQAQASRVSGLQRQAAHLVSSTTLLDSDLRRVRPSAEVRRVLDLPSGIRVLCFERRRDAGDGALVLMRTYFPPHVAEDLDRALLATVAPLQVVASAGHPIERTIQTIGAVSASAPVARRLGCQPGDALLRLGSTCLDGFSRPILYSEHLSCADRFELTMTLTEAGAGQLPNIVRLPRGRD